jgi:hypothetical protein
MVTSAFFHRCMPFAFLLLMGTTSFAQESLAQTDTSKPFRQIPNEFILVFDHPESNVNLKYIIGSLNGQQLINENQKKSTVNLLNLEFNYLKLQPGDLKFLNLQRMILHLDSNQLEKVKKDTRFKRIEKNYEILKPYGVEFKTRSEQHSQAQIVDWGVKRSVIQVRQNINSAHKVWIIDSGVDKDHEDLNINTILSRSFVPDHNYYDVDGYMDFHGTHVAGIIGAKNNEIGCVGIAPNVEIVAFKVVQDGKISDYNFYLEALYAASLECEPGDVVNISLENTPGGETEIENIQNIAKKGVYVVISAGNACKNLTTTPLYPAHITGVNIFTVSSFDNSESFSSFSNFGQPALKYISPGRDIYSTLPKNNYGLADGTSESAPHVSGILILVQAIKDDRVVLCPYDNKKYFIAHE